jgi:3-oxoacyl-(acyl-carrier-protein) synthase
VIPLVSPSPVDDVPADMPALRALEPTPAATGLAYRVAAAGFEVLAASAWPQSPADMAPPAVAGFVTSSFSPLAAEVARRCLDRWTAAAGARTAEGTAAIEPSSTAVIIASSLGDIAGARHVARAVDAGTRVGPLLFFQCVPNAVAGHIAARWGLAGPVICIGDERSALDAAALLLEDADAGAALLIRVDQAASAGEHDRAEAALLTASAPEHERSRA